MARSFQWMVVFLTLTTGLWAQEKRPRIQVQHYSIDADVNPRTQSLSATAKVTFLPLEATSAVVFELNTSLNVSKVVDSQGQNIPTNRDKEEGTIRLMMPVTLAKNQPVTVTFTYDGRITGNEDGPIPGIKFAALHPENGYLLYPARWFPVGTYTVDRYSADMRIAAPSEYKVIASGDETLNKAGDRTIHSFIYKQNSFPGSIALVKEEPVKVSSQGINTRVFFRGEHIAEAQAYGEETGKMMSFFTSIYGLAPQADLTLVETEAGSVSGYVAPGIVFLAPSAIGKQVNVRALSNALSRQWWGILVSPTSRNHMWFVNGGARYSELLYLEHLGGPGAAENDIRSTYVEALTIADPPVLQAGRLDDYSPEYWALTAARGASVLNMLRAVVSDAVFKKALQAFMDKYSWKSANTEDLRKVFEQVAGSDFRYFFLQWLESTGSPDFKLEYTVFRTQKGFRIVGKITEDLDTFRMPVELRIETEGNPEDKVVEVTGSSSEFSLDTFGKPRMITIDPQHRILRYDKSMRVQVAIRRGDQFVEIGDFANALKEYQKALDVNGNSSLAHYRIGEMFFKQNNFQSAANEFRSAINGDLDPKWTDVWSHIYLGKIFDVTGQRDRAVNEYKQAIRTRDNTAGAQEQAAQYSTKPYERAHTES
jgi:tetratricopeptide (TPR) repeat protein